MLSPADKTNVLNEFPNIKLSYENITHKKVFNPDYIVAIPEGKKCFAWFTSVNDKIVCVIMELTSNKQISEIKIVNACFSKELSYGTILYGTVFYHLNNSFFTIEDIFFIKGTDISKENGGEKLINIKKMLKQDLKQVSYNNSFIIFGLPVMSKTNEELETKIKTIKYKIDSIQFKLFSKGNSFLYMKYNSYLVPNNQVPNNQVPNNQVPNQNFNTKKDTIFLIRPDTQNDIYYLYCLNDELKDEQYGTAHIPDYTTSVMMNKLFRIIKENNNLDALEESDDEEEFENENVDKFVRLDKSYKMICQFNYKFKKWHPIKLANEQAKIITKSELHICSTNNYGYNIKTQYNKTQYNKTQYLRTNRK